MIELPPIPPPRLITSELFLQGPRTAAVPVVTLVNWVGNMLVGFTFPSMAIALGSQVRACLYVRGCENHASGEGIQGRVLGTFYVQFFNPE